MMIKNFIIASSCALIGANALAKPQAIITNATSNNIAIYDIASDGDLIFPAKSQQTAYDPEDWGVYNHGHNYFNVGSNNQTIWLFSINSDNGQLTHFQSLATGILPWALLITSDNKCAYISNFGENTISQYKINPNGVFTQLNKYPTKLNRPAHIMAYVDKYLVTLYEGSNKVATYARDPQNCLITGSVDIQSGNLLSPNRGTIIKDNLYIVSSMDNAIVHYKLSDDGMLNYQGKNLTRQVEPMSFGNLDNNFLYATYRQSHQIEVFKINQVNGSLASIQTIPSGGFGVRHIAFNKAGTVAYATNQFSNQVTIFLVDKASGRLTKKSIINSGGVEPYGISIVD